MNLALAIERSGTFEVRWTGSDAQQCGVRGTRRLKYHVRIEARDKHLTPEGFIIDNQAIDRLFQRRYGAQRPRPFVSCERIASDVCRVLHRRFGRGKLRNVQITALQVTVGMAGGPAHITASWRRDA